MAFNPLHAQNSPFGTGAAYATPQEAEKPTLAEQLEAAILSLALNQMQQHGIDPTEAWTRAKTFWDIAFERAGDLKKGDPA